MFSDLLSVSTNDVIRVNFSLGMEMWHTLKDFPTSGAAVNITIKKNGIHVDLSNASDSKFYMVSSEMTTDIMDSIEDP